MTEDLELHVGVGGEKAFAAAIAQMSAAVAKLDANVNKLTHDMAPAAKGMQGVGASAKSSGGMLSSFGGIAGGIAVAGLAAMVTGAAKAAISYETLSVQLAVLLKDAAKVPAVLNEWKKFSDLTPMEPEQVNRGGKQLLAFGVAVDQVIPKMRVLGDISSGSGKDFNELIAIYGKAKAAGKVQGEILQQLVEGGINILPEFAKIMNVTQGEVAKLGSEGKISFEMFDQALKNMTASGSLYGGMMDKMSQSTEGLISSLKGELDGALREIGMAMLPFINDLVRAAIPAIQQAIPYIRAFGQGLVQAKDVIYGAISDLVAPFQAMFTSIGRLISVFTGATNASMTFGSALEGILAFTAPIRAAFTMGAEAVGYLVNKFADIIEQNPLIQGALSGIASAVETVAGWIGSLSGGAPGFLSTIIDVVDAIDSVLNPLRLVGTAWAYIFGDGSESIGGLAESTKGILVQLNKVARDEFGATTAQIQAFAQSFDTAELAGMGTAQATDYLKDRFAAFIETCNAAGTAATDTGTAIGNITAKAIPAAGSIDALNEQLSKLRDQFNAVSSASERMSLGQDIAELETTIERVTAQGAPLDTLVMKTQEANRALVDMGGVAQRSMRDASQLAADAAAAFAAAEPAILSFKEKMLAALGEKAIGELKQGLDSIKSAFMDFGASVVQSVGYAIGAGKSLKDAFIESLKSLMVEVPRLAGMALLNAAAAGPPSPASLPMAVAGLALLGLSGILKGVQDANKTARETTLAGLPTSAGGSQAQAQGGNGGFAELVGATQEKPVVVNVTAELDGVNMGGLISRVLVNHGKQVIKNR